MLRDGSKAPSRLEKPRSPIKLKNLGNGLQMIKCFLSHSSLDKPYVREVYAKLRKESVIFDEMTFEEGMSPSEEIIAGLDDTSLFVLFISHNALESPWVRDELSRAKDRVDQGIIDRIYPIIIDESITYADKRIPGWMKKGFNIQHIRQTKVCARKINARMREISWKTHPTLKEREQIFVGRNDQIKRLEERLDDLSLPTPQVVIASGLSSIGRKAFLRNSLKKASVIRESYEFPLISLETTDSIEDFILKLDDLGLSESRPLKNALNTRIDQKIQMALDLAQDIAREKERVLIEDRGAIVQYDGEIVDWFSSIIEQMKGSDHVLFCISSKFRANKRIARQNPAFYMEELPELDKAERSGLLKRYSRFKKLEIEKDDLLFFADLLTGYPDQVIFAVDTISDSSVYEAKRSSHVIQEYASDKARVIVEQYRDDQKALDFLYLLSKFEFVSFDFIFGLVGENEYYEILNSFLISSVCERLGGNGDYIRLNEVVRDYIARNRFGMPVAFAERLREYVKEFLATYQDDNKDISEYIFSMQEALISGASIDERILIPSYFLKTIRHLYDANRNYKEVIRLSDRVLVNEAYLHKDIVIHIRFMKCQALARLREPDFFSEVKHIPEPDNSFLHGFFYRISGQQEKALTSYQRVLQRKPNDFKTKSEIVLVYMQSDEHELAYDLAKEVYERIPNNPLNANNYLSCLFYKDRHEVDRQLLEELALRLKSNPSNRSQEMYSSARAKILANFDGDLAGAFSLIEESINRYPDVNYPILTLADLAIQHKQLARLERAVKLLDNTATKSMQTYRTYIRYKATYLAMKGQKSSAVALVHKELSGIRRESLTKLCERLMAI
jgi:tetratricopeptide (TPR) repeat protein